MNGENKNKWQNFSFQRGSDFLSKRGDHSKRKEKWLYLQCERMARSKDKYRLLEMEWILIYVDVVNKSQETILLNIKYRKRCFFASGLFKLSDQLLCCFKADQFLPKHPIALCEILRLILQEKEGGIDGD